MRFAPNPRRAFAAVLAGLAALAAPGSARAAFVADSMVYVQSSAPTAGPGYFTGTVAVDNISKTSASVQITLTNTSPLANGGYLTALAFNLPGTITSASLTTSYNPNTAQSFNLIGGVTSATPKGDFSNDVTTGPLGTLDIGAAVGPDWHSSGTASNGLAPGETGTFTFTLNGSSSNLNNLTAQALMDLLSVASGGSGRAALAVRFRGFSGNPDNDKVVGGVVCPPPPTNPPGGAVPAPPGVLLGLLGAGCLFGRKFRRRVASA